MTNNIMDNIVLEDIIDMKNEYSSSSSSSSSSIDSRKGSMRSMSPTTSDFGKRNGQYESDLLSQLMRDITVSVAVQNLPKTVATTICKKQLILQNRFREKLRSIAPQLKKNENEIVSIKPETFVNDLDNVLDTAVNDANVTTKSEAKALKNLLKYVENDLADRGMSQDEIANILDKILRFQRDFIKYLMNVDAPKRIAASKPE